MTGQLGSQMKSRLEFDIACGRASIAWGPIGLARRAEQSRAASACLAVRSLRTPTMPGTGNDYDEERSIGGGRGGMLRHAKSNVATAVR